MVKDILIKSANFIGYDEISLVLKISDNLDSIEDNQIKTDIIKLLSFYNYITSTIFELYLNLEIQENRFSSSTGDIYFSTLSKRPVKILEVEDELYHNVNFLNYIDHIKLKQGNKLYSIKYSYLPDETKDINSKTNFSMIYEKIIAEAICEEFLASKNLFKESEYWHNKFMFDIFKLKTKKEHRMRNTFCR